MRRELRTDEELDRLGDVLVFIGTNSLRAKRGQPPMTKTEEKALLLRLADMHAVAKASRKAKSRRKPGTLVASVSPSREANRQSAPTPVQQKVSIFGQLHRWIRLPKSRRMR